MSAPTWTALRAAIEKMVAYPAGAGWHVSREAANKALEWIGWAEVHQPSPVPKLLPEEDEDLSLVWRTVDGWAIHRTFPRDAEPYWLAMPSRTPEALAASPEVLALIAAATADLQSQIAALSPPPEFEEGAGIGFALGVEDCRKRIAAAETRGWNAAIEAAAKEPAQAAFRAGARGPREAGILHDVAADAERAIRALKKGE